MARSRSFVFVALAAVALFMFSQAFVSSSPRNHALQASSVAMSAEGGSSGAAGFELPVFPEDEENNKSASIVFCFILGLAFPILHGFTFGLVLAALGWGLANGGLSNFAKKSESLKEASGYVDQVADASMSAGALSLRAYNFVANKTKGLMK
eukprot:TRINITY_DN7982_c0_g3_i1.p1 TRINITY_DN7982_c0_g3~~TRINITY_DN7982_c0_g3_i1.p1  ORF type:complete len:173 (-),score=40.85 TRINITY_DN7982_c0_g3_i1:123-578(-)